MPIVMDASVPIKDVTWKEVDPDDILGALKTMNGLPRSGRLFGYRGAGVDRYLRWAAEELRGTIAADQERRWTNALSHAKRAVDCVFDAYLEREHLHVALPARANFKAKSALLAKRFGVSWPKHLIDTVIARPRNDSEHEFAVPDLSTATNAVEGAATVVEALRARVEPLQGIALINGFLGSVCSSGDAVRTVFDGYSNPFAVCWTAPVEQGFAPWVGVGHVGTDVEVQWCWLSKFGEVRHLELIDAWDPKATGSHCGEIGIEALLNGIGLGWPPCN